MARRGTGRFQRRRPQAARHDDRISDLSDDLLLLILRRVDTRTALHAGTLSRRWTHLPRELPAVLDFRVGDRLPPRYHRWVLAHRDICSKGTHLQYGRHCMEKEVKPNMIRRLERLAMRDMARSVESFLDAADDGDWARRTVSSLSLEFLSSTDNNASSSIINRLIAKAIDVGGAADLEAVAKPMYGEQEAHTFPSHGLCEDPRASRLRSLKLGGCVLPPLLHEYGALTTLVLQGMPESTPKAAYEGVFAAGSCPPQLQVLHLISCRCRCNAEIVVDGPTSDIRELVVDKCSFRRIRMRALPSLERLASLGTRVFFESASFPCLRQYNLAWCPGEGIKDHPKRFGSPFAMPISMFFKHTPEITSLVLRFSGPLRWIAPLHSSSLPLTSGFYPLTSCFFPPPTLLPHLRRLLVADVPSFWDASWPRLLFETAPSLDTLHVHYSTAATCNLDQEEPAAGDEIAWHEQGAITRHRHLREFVMVGFDAADVGQARLVKFVSSVSRALRHVGLIKDGHALADKGHWDWELVTTTTQQHSSWTEEEKAAVMKTTRMDRRICPSWLPQLQIVFG